MKSASLFRLVWLLAGLALVLAFARDPLLGLIPPPRELPRADGRSGLPWITGGFVPQTYAPGLLPPRIQHASSWVDHDDWTGRSESAWFRANRRIIHVGVAGHPHHPDCTLWIEFKLRDDSIRRVDCRIPDPGEEWNIWEVRTPADAVAVRVVAEDHARGPAGWVAFSHPFRTWPGTVYATYQFFQVVTMVALALTLVWGPGLLATPRHAPPELQLVVLLGAGPLLLAAFGVLVWALGPWISVRLLGTALVAASWLALGLAARRRRFTFSGSPLFHRALAVSALVALAAVAKSSYSVGPQDELFRGAVSRNLALSDRIDSRFNYYTVQVAAHGYTPADPRTEMFFAPWTFFSRGPLAGLTTLPVVMATQGTPRDVMPDHRWSPFDRTGFAAYRVTMIVLASMIVVAAFLALTPLLGEPWALIAAGLLALSPFGVHEVMFTWPKWSATAWVLAAFAFVQARRPALGGLALGVGFLFHPLALLWAPWIGLWAGGRAWREAPAAKPAALILAGIRCTAGACVLVLPWMALGAWMPHLPDTAFAGQAGFFSYWTRADWHFATWETWWRTRWMNFANTFVPLHLVFDPASFNHPKLGSPYWPSGPLVKFSQVWWNSLPFALGLGLWLASGYAVLRALRTHFAATLLFVAVPAIFVVAYWGMDPLGLMRECLHPFFVTLIALTCLIALRHGGRLRAALAHPAVPWLQLPETFLMLWLTTLLNPRPWSVEHPQLDPVYLGINALALLLAARVLSRGRAAATA